MQQDKGGENGADVEVRVRQDSGRNTFTNHNLSRQKSNGGGGKEIKQDGKPKLVLEFEVS